MGSLLSTQTLLDTLGGLQRIMAWHNSTSTSEVEVSAVSVGQALELIQPIEDLDRRQKFENALDSFLAIISVFGNLVDFDEACARQWSELQGIDLPYVSANGEEAALGAASRMVVATALARNATLVESPQPYHAHIPRLRTVSP